MSRIIPKALSLQNRGSASWISQLATFSKFSIDVYTIEYSVTGWGIKGKKPTRISGTPADDIKTRIPTYDGIMSLQYHVSCHFNTNPE